MTDISGTLDAIWRIESARIVATLAKMTGDVGLAEDLAQEALVDALSQWQDRSRWDRSQIGRGKTALQRADAVGRGRGNYSLQAAIAECHAIAPTFNETDWSRIVVLYEALGRLAPSPVVELNRAVAVSMATGPESALRIVDGMDSQGALRGSHLLPSVRGELLARLGRIDEARSELLTAAALTANEQEKAVLKSKAACL